MTSQQPAEDDPICAEETISTAADCVNELLETTEIQAEVDELVKTVVEFVSEAASTAADDVDHQQRNAADESAKSRFGISSHEIAIPCKEFDRLLRKIALKPGPKRQCPGKRMCQPRKVKASASDEKICPPRKVKASASDEKICPPRKVKASASDGVSAKIPKLSENGTAGGKQKKKKVQNFVEFDQVMASLLGNFEDDPIFLKCKEVQGMTKDLAQLTFQINQFLCHFITLIPVEMLGNIKNKETFTEFNILCVQKAVDEKGVNHRDEAELLKKKMMFTLATTVNYARYLPQCKEGISYAMRTFPGLAYYLKQVRTG
ncbi:hypothetical protein niasHT_005377 [Heterodera trifolii]|uniref:Uncharacterized protein n=1 Tax=Heterodera trifolii TaxID=157864 RepID=A0ABD2M0T9_9BILA